MAALNAVTKKGLVFLNTKLKRDGGSERPNREEVVALNVKTEKK